MPMLITKLVHPEYHAQLTSLHNTLWYSGCINAATTIQITSRMMTQNGDDDSLVWRRR